MIQEIANALVESWRNFATAFVLFVPRLVAATIIFAGGFFVALLVRRAIQRFLAWLGADRVSLRIGASEMLRQADMPTAEALIAKIVFWIVWIGFIVSAVDTLQFSRFRDSSRSSSGSSRVSCWRCWCSRSASWSAIFSGVPRCWRP